ncbi:MAG TPA: DUF3990 domain-containing protein [Longimicrobiaceae bacterium]
MSTPPIFQRTQPWTNQSIRLYHGTIAPNAPAMWRSGVKIEQGRVGTDFGPGFYTTTIERQARSWAWQLANRRRSAAVILYADLDREALAGLDSLAFVRGDFDAEDYWSLVTHCRSGGMDHARSGSSGFYDMVTGPVALAWRQRALFAGADQISFHTPAAEAVLNAVRWSTIP